MNMLLYLATNADPPPATQTVLCFLEGTDGQSKVRDAGLAGGKVE